MPNTVLSAGSGVDSSGSMSTLSREENTAVMSSEDSSSYPDESELELGLGLSLSSAEIYCPSASSSSSSPVTKTNTNTIGSKRSAEPSSPPGRSALSQVAGWPPIGAYRMNSLVNHAKSPVTELSDWNVDKCENMNIVVDKTNYNGNRNNNVAKRRGPLKTSLFVKVNTDGISIGRKVDLYAHSCYETLAQMLDQMFTLSSAVGARRSNLEEQVVMARTGQPARLLDSSSDFVLTYEDKEGDWMLVGDVPWEMFLSSVRRLRIRRTAEANGLAPRSHKRK